MVDRFAPKVVDIETLSKGISKKLKSKLEYECDLLNMDLQSLFKIASHLFKEPEEEPMKTIKIGNNSNEEDNYSGPYYSDDDYTYPYGYGDGS